MPLIEALLISSLKYFIFWEGKAHFYCIFDKLNLDDSTIDFFTLATNLKILMHCYAIYVENSYGIKNASSSYTLTMIYFSIFLLCQLFHSFLSWKSAKDLSAMFIYAIIDLG